MDWRFTTIIAFFVERFSKETIGGVKSYLRRIIPSLKAKGIESIIVTQKTASHTDQIEEIDDLKVYRIDSGDLIDRIDQFNKTPLDAKAESAKKLFKKDDIESAAMKLSKGLSTFIKEYKPRSIHFHNSYFLAPYALYFLKQNQPMKYPPSYYFWNHSPNKKLVLPGGSEESLYSVLSSFQNMFKGIYSISKSAHESMLKEGINSKVKYLGVDHTKFEKRSNYKVNLRKRLDLPPNSFILLYTGRLIKDKGLDLLPEIFKQLCAREKEYSNLHIVLTGEGEFKEELNSIINSKEVSSNVHITRVYGDDEIIDVYSQSNGFILPSRREALGLSLLEAMSCSLPCIASDLPGIRELIIHGQNGLLVPVDNISEFVRWIDAIYTSEKLRNELSQNARKTVEEKFTYQKHIRFVEVRLLH